MKPAMSKDTIAYYTNDGFLFVFKKEAQNIIDKHFADKPVSTYKLLSTDPSITEYIHNLAGPAAVDLTSGKTEYWINGEIANEGEEEFKRHGFNPKFAEDYEDILMADEDKQ